MSLRSGELLCGCNYWASHAGMYMWRNWDPGVVEEDLIYFYLAAQLCNVVTTINARSLMWISRVRCCNRAQWEIKELADLMLAEVYKVAHSLTCTHPQRLHEQ
jgi:thymidylate synthase ThyX